MARPKDAPRNAPDALENRPVAAAPVTADAPPKPPLRLEWIEAGSLTENPLNWRRHSQEQLQSLRELLDDPQIGWAGACLYNERTGRLIDGHARREVVDPKTPVPVLVGSWSEEAEAKILATLDPVGANAPRTLGRTFPGAGVDGAIQAGLEALVQEYLGREWPRAGQGGGVLRIEKCLVDMGYKPGIVAAVKHKAGGAAMVLSKGVGIRAGARPMSMYRRHPGEVHGHNWYFPNVSKSSEFPHVAFDANWWKTFVHARLSVTPGDPGALTLFGKAAGDHALFAEHIAGSEAWTLTHGHGRDVQEWKLKPSRPDNHWLDCLVGCAVAASLCGVRLPGMDAKPGRQRKRYTQEDFRR